ncbi:hypothetical protein ACFWZ2_04405 [Streptomyces sp. NPDC059002]|uniref:hypothetical protein n=1 Tax=Streptomyces sp. NPDC059002 TaxID=3346690 RepID=UPI0036968DFA
MRETEIIGQPYELAVTREDGRIVEVRITAVGDGGELTAETISQAHRALSDRLRQEEFRARRSSQREASRSALEALKAASTDKITDAYLAHLAAAYVAILDGASGVEARGVMSILATATGRSASTVKMHVVKARKEGFLTETGGGKAGGDLTDKARKLTESAE